ncbi:helix-turn-helix transcriptional regulator [Streptomyces sp. NPDC048845]|uniref:helix-turn-helix domain-containing protein n=1 Tax=Streptomyces sp. NPDC048845 TaxID=3155390 RepID=UPI003447F34F
MTEKNAKSATLRYFGSQMRMWRQRAGITRERLAAEVGYSVETISSVEQGRRMPQPSLLEAADDVLGAGGLLKGGGCFLVREKYPDWFQEYASYEAEAVALGLYEPMAMPGLFQTEEYARAVYAGSCPPLDDEAVELSVRARIERQAILVRPKPPCVSVVVEEGVLRRRIGGTEVMKGQIRRLMESAQWRNVTMQVMPTERDMHPGLAGAMVLLESAEHRNFAYLEGQRGSLLISDPDDVSVLTQRFGIIRAQALSPDESMRLMDQVAQEL